MWDMPNMAKRRRTIQKQRSKDDNMQTMRKRDDKGNKMKRQEK